MKKAIFLLITALYISLPYAGAQNETITPPLKRMLWASINGLANTTNNDYKVHNGKVLVTWRMFPTDDTSTAFDLYCKRGNAAEKKINTEPVSMTTNFRDTNADRSVDNVYRLCYAGTTETLDTYTLTAYRASNQLPYVPIPLKTTEDIHSTYLYKANDISIGDLDGDGVYEIIVKRLVVTTLAKEDEGEDDDDPDGEAPPVIEDVYHSMLLEAYRLDGTFLWRMKLGPNVLSSYSSGSFAVYDFDGDGKCEIALRTSEGTIFGDGAEIGDINGDKKIDYRISGKGYIPAGCPEFLSVVDGMTGKELARTDYIPLGKSEDWGDGYYNRSTRFRVSLGRFSDNTTSILMCRGIYRKMVLQAWDFKNNKLTQRWNFDTTDGVHTAYAGQGNHSLSIGDVDDDGYDEVVYGACTIDHDGMGLNNSGFKHGDALHLGKFDPSRDGLQIWSCFEGGTVGAAFRDARSGDVIWKYDNKGDIGRALIADIDADNPGYEMWWNNGNVHSCDGVDLGYKPGSCNMAIWFSGSLSRQLLDRGAISGAKTDKGRVFTIYEYDVTTINSTKSNPCFYGDILGDWREEVIMVARDNSELRLFSTWYPCDYKFPYLMSDHVYEMSAINQNVGYNQPTQLGYYLGPDLLKGMSVTDATSLKALITYAQQTLEESINVIHGTYPQTQIDKFEAAIARAIIIAGTTNLKDTDYIQAATALIVAEELFELSLIPHQTELINPNFEYKAAGEFNDGAVVRGTPYGWQQLGIVAGNSFGINQDATNYDGDNLCWYNVNESPYAMPEKFELYQELSLPAGRYKLTCRLGVRAKYFTNVRLFANNHVQYYGTEADYINNLTFGEINSFANWAGSPTSSIYLNDMMLEVDVHEDELLRVGIRSSNLASDGINMTGSNSSNVYGGFKVDYFQLERIGGVASAVTSSSENEINTIIYKVEGGIGVQVTAPARVMVYSLMGNLLHDAMTESEIRVSMPQGVYVVKIGDKVYKIHR